MMEPICTAALIRGAVVLGLAWIVGIPLTGPMRRKARCFEVTFPMRAEKEYEIRPTFQLGEG